MNKIRRNQLEEIANKLERLQSELYLLKDEEEEYYENMPESIQGGEKGDRAYEVIDILEEAGCSFDELAETIRSAAE